MFYIKKYKYINNQCLKSHFYLYIYYYFNYLQFTCYHTLKGYNQENVNINLKYLLKKQQTITYKNVFY